jgi:hypothetical protein
MSRAEGMSHTLPKSKAYALMVGASEGKVQWQDLEYVGDVGWGDMNWVNLLQQRDQCKALRDTV